VRLDEAEKSGKKYILHHKEGNLWRIMACTNFGNVKKGHLGGLIESEKNLYHNDDCWVYKGGEVYEKAKIYGNAKIYSGVVCGSAQIYGHAEISG